MAQISNNPAADGLTIDTANKAARTRLFGDTGVIDRANGDARSTLDRSLPMIGLNDDNYRAIRTDRLGNLLIGNTSLLFHEPFEGATLGAFHRYNTTTVTFAPAQTAAGGYNFNSTNLLTAGAANLLVSTRQFLRTQRAPLHNKFRARIAQVANAVQEIGLGFPASAIVSPTIGAYFQVTAAGVLQGVLSFNGVDQTTSPIVLPGGWQNNFYVWDIIVEDDEALFMVQDTLTGFILAERRIQLTQTAMRLFNATHLPTFARLHNVTAPATAPNLILASWDVFQLDIVGNRPWAETLALNGFGGEVNPVNYTQVANYANSAAPTNATLSNTVAGYTTLGGQFAFAAVAGAETDYALFGFTVPTPYSFVCQGIDIDTFNTGAIVATTPHVLQWFASNDQTAISLATANNRRTTLGIQNLPVGAAIGAQANALPPRPLNLVTHGGRIMVVGLKMPIATATALQVLRGTVSIRGYFE